MAEMQSRLTCAQIDIQVLKNENQDQNRNCAEHFKEHEGLRLSDMKNRGLISELRQMEKRIEDKFLGAAIKENRIVDDDELEQLTKSRSSLDNESKQSQPRIAGNEP